MTQLTFAFATVPANPADHSFATPPVAMDTIRRTRSEKSNLLVQGRFPRRQRRAGLRQLGDVLTEVLDRYGETND